MIEIKTQAEFLAQVNNPSTSEIIRIYPRSDGDYYELTSRWLLPSNVTIQGVGKPTIKFTPSSVPTGTLGMIEVRGTSSSKRENIFVRGLSFKINEEATRLGIRGFHINYCGETPLTSYTLIGDSTTLDVPPYDSSLVGANITTPVKKGILIEDCVFYNFYDDSIRIENSAQCIVRNNNFSKVNDSAISLNKSMSNTITGNHIVGNAGSSGAIRLTDNCYSNIITENHIYDSYYGIYLDSCIGNIVNNNSLHSTRGNSIGLFAGSYTTIVGNNSINSGGSAISGFGTSSNAIVGNNFENSYLRGFTTLGSPSDYNAIVGNTIENSRTEGVHVNGVSLNTITGNIIRGSTNNDISHANSTNHVIYSNIYKTISASGTGTVVNSNVVLP